MRFATSIPKAFLAVLLASQSVATAQYVIDARAGLVNAVNGNVFLEQDRIGLNPAKPLVLKVNQMLSTQDGMVELLLTPDVFLRLGDLGRVRLEASRLEDTRVIVERGSALIEVVELAKGTNVQVRCADTVTRFRRQGLYRFDADQGKLLVYGGEAEVKFTGRPSSVTAKRGASVDLKNDLRESKFDLKAQDRLHQWSGHRSADLFSANPLARTTKLQWVLLGDPRGLIWNPDYGMKVLSNYARLELQRRKMLEAGDAAREKQVADYLDNNDRQQEQNRREAAQKAAQAPPTQAATPTKSK